MLNRFLALAAFVTATAAGAAEPVWDKVELGMTRSQVEALYPKGGKVKYEAKQLEIADVPIMGKCEAEANIYFNEAGVVDQVKIAGDPSMGGRCSKYVMAALASNYGQPMLTDGSFGRFLARQGKMVTWKRADGVTLQFKKYENGIFGGGGLMKASWELTYTNMGGSIAL